MRIIDIITIPLIGILAAPIEASFSMKAALSVNGLAVLVLGLVPGALITWVAASF